MAAALGLPLLLLLGVGGYRVFRVAALQNALVHREGVMFAGGKDGSRGPEWATKGVDSLMAQLDGTDAEEFVWRERLLAMVRPETDVIVLTTSNAFHADFTPALQRFPKLRVFGFVDDKSGTITKDDVEMLLTLLGRMKDLESINIYTPHLTDASFAKFAGHPRLNRVQLGHGNFSSQILETLKTLPNLKELTILTRVQDSKWHLENTEQLYRDALPGTTVTFLPY